MLFILARSANKVLIASADTICVQMNLFGKSVVQSAGWVRRERGLSVYVDPLIAGNDESTAAPPLRAVPRYDAIFSVRNQLCIWYN